MGSQPHGPALTHGLLERDGELAAVDETIRNAATGDGTVLAISAPAGVGKSELMAELRERASAAGFRVLHARADELEHDLAFGVVRQLLTPAVIADPALIATGAAALAGPALGFEGRRDEIGDPMSAALHGLHWLCSDLSARRPLLLAVDDAHWADEASLRFMAYLARRIEGLPLLLGVAARPEEPGASRRLLDDLAGSPTTVVRPDPLSPAGTAELVRRRLPAAGDDVCLAFHETTGGNPFLIGELAASLSTQGDASAISAGAIAGAAPGTVARSVLIRLARLPQECARLAKSVALFPEGAELRHVAALAGLDDDAAAIAADQLAAAHVLAPSRPLVFLHPLMRTAVYRDLPAGAASRAHARAAELLIAEDAAAEMAAGHLLVAEPAGRPEFARVLMEAGARATAAGAPDAACRYLRRALAEPAPGRERAGVLHQLGLAEMLIGSPGAVERLRDAVEFATEESERRRAAFDLGRALGLSGHALEGARVLDEAVASFATDAPPAEVLRYRAEALWLLSQDPRGIADYHERLEAMDPELRADTLGERMILCHISSVASAASPALTLARRALDGMSLREAGLDAAPAMSFAIATLVICGELSEALRLNREATEDMRSLGTLAAVPMGHAGQSYAAWLLGDLEEAELQARMALAAVADQHPEHPARRSGLAALIRALVDRGQLDEAASVAPCGTIPAVDQMAWSLCEARGVLRTSLGELEGAAADLEQVRSWNERRSERDVGDSWRGYLALVRARQGRIEEARQIADDLLADARRFGSDWPIGEALRIAALTRDGDERIELLREAVDVLARTQTRLLHAKTLVDLGGSLRRAGRRAESREPLREGLRLARLCGAAPVAAYAEEELRATGARLLRRALSGVESLTPSERRIVRLAAEGSTNREIAAELWLTVKTVEMHLSNAYRKLDVKSRADLPSVMAVGQPAESS